MRIGYEGSALGVKETDFIEWNPEDLSEEKRIEIITHNLKSLENLLDYHMENHIGFYCIDSNLIPFGANEQIDLPWWEMFQSEFQKIGEKISDAKFRITMISTKATVLSTLNEEVSLRAIKELENLAKVFKALNLGTEHKIIIQIGNLDESKQEAMERFKKIYAALDKTVQMRLALRNDETCCNVLDVLELGETLHLPVVFHYRNHQANPSISDKDGLECIRDCKATWQDNDGDQIVYYSEMNSGSSIESLAETIGIKSFLDFYGKLDRELDIVFEVKDRNLSAIKCINSIRELKDIKVLEVEWRRYKYSVLENSHVAYLRIRSLLKEKDNYPVVPFYTLIEEALDGKKRAGFVNAAQHVWGYFKKCATEKEKTDFLKMMEDYKSGMMKMEEIKENLWVLSVKYKMKYLLESYYFIL